MWPLLVCLAPPNLITSSPTGLLAAGALLRAVSERSRWTGGARRCSPATPRPGHPSGRSLGRRRSEGPL
ncbi:unnamed protein product [Boreogadus saida]